MTISMRMILLLWCADLLIFKESPSRAGRVQTPDSRVRVITKFTRAVSVTNIIRYWDKRTTEVLLKVSQTSNVFTNPKAFTVLGSLDSLLRGGDL